MIIGVDVVNKVDLASGRPEETALGPVIAADADAFRLAYEEVLA